MHAHSMGQVNGVMEKGGVQARFMSMEVTKGLSEIGLYAIKSAQLKKAVWQQMVQSAYYPLNTKESITINAQCMALTNLGVQSRIMRMDPWHEIGIAARIVLLKGTKRVISNYNL